MSGLIAHYHAALMDAQVQPESPHKLESQRRANRDAIAALGLFPYGERVDGLISVSQARGLYDPSAEAAQQALPEAAGGSGPADARPIAAIAGRIMLLRDNGKLIWLQIRDESGDMQVALSKKDLNEREFGFAKLLDLGDIIIVRGRVMKTRTGETTLWAEHIRPGAKCLTPPPEKHAGLTDVELRYRKRYVDLWSNPETLAVFRVRAAVVGAIRRELEARGFTEVETPMLQALAGGAAARPFTTHMQALDIPLYLRIAPELYLKRLLVGGMRRVFEINRNFRNEGLDKQHNPEFTMLEAYEAYGDCASVMALTEDLVRGAARAAAQAQGLPRPVLPFGDWSIDYDKPFERVAYEDLFERAVGFPSALHDRVVQDVRRRGLSRKIKGAPPTLQAPQTQAATGADDHLSRIDPVLLINTLFEEVAEPTLDPSVPTFITDYPSAISPLTRAKTDNPALAERADLFIGGMEIAPHYTELNDPDVQEARFRTQLAGIDDEEQTFRTLDHDFLDALKVGMPPAGGMGLGIDRLVMLLSGQRTIRDVMLFPMMRPLDR